MNETQLHYKILRYVRNKYPFVITIAGLGELQQTPYKGMDARQKGYIKGQPDLILLRGNSRFHGLAVEIKTPTGRGRLSPEQRETKKTKFLCFLQ